MSMPKGDSFIILYAIIVCLVCSLMLSVTASVLKKPQDYNVEIDRKMNVLKAFGVSIYDENHKRIKPPVVEGYFSNHISEVTIDSTSGQVVDNAAAAKEPLPLYVWKEDNGTITKYAFPCLLYTSPSPRD